MQPMNNIYPTLYQANLEFIPSEMTGKRSLMMQQQPRQTLSRVGQSQTQPVFFATAIAIVSILLIIFITFLVVNLTITQRLGRLASLTRKFTTGDTSVRADIAGHDEIQLVATSMNSDVREYRHPDPCSGTPA